jgi:hypothetical protein
MGQQRWLDRHQRQSHIIIIGDQSVGPTHWQRTRRLIEVVRPNKKRHRVRAHLYTKRNGTSRRGKPWRLLRMADTHKGAHGGVNRTS